MNIKIHTMDGVERPIEDHGMHKDDLFSNICENEAEYDIADPSRPVWERIDLNRLANDLKVSR